MKSALILIFGTILAHRQLYGKNEVNLFATEAPPPLMYGKDLPENILSEILTILINGTVHLIGNCTVDNDASHVQYWLYTREVPQGQLISFESTNFRRPTMILLHGWGGNKNIDYIRVIRKAYLKRYNANVIEVDYGYYVAADYISSYCKLPQVAANVARFLCKLNRYRKLSRLHVVGHSLGGQVAGMAGYLVQQKCGIIGRVTGLDPAGPLFQDVNTQVRLDATDATFVDVVHTNQGQYGYVGNIGDVDFYGNCGTYQPGCWRAVLENITVETILDVPVNYITCNHQRSCYYFAESITNNSFLATAIYGPLICIEDDYNGVDRTYMGEYCRSPQNYETYNFKTNAESPYGQGPDGPLQ